MPEQFDERGYCQRLIDSGMDAAEARELAAKMAAARRDSGKAVSPALPPLVADLELTPQKPTAVDAVAKRVSRVVEKRKTSKEPGAAVALSDQVNQAQQAALLKRTKEQIREQQLSLFDIAPWSDDMRAMPNDWLRSALFTVRNKRTPRDMLDRQPIYHVNKDVSITYTGWELRAYDDELVLHQVLEYCKRLPLGEPATFTFYEICQDLDWPINKSYYEKVNASLTRLQASAMQFSSERVGRLESVSLIRRFRILDKGNKRKQRCQVEIDQEIVLLFAGDHYTRFVWEKYRKLSPTARRMFDYFATHKEPFPLPLEKFRLMCGSDSTRLKKWREQANEAAKELCDSGLVSSAWVLEDRVHCKR
jgi:hypothetical protein